MSKKPNLSELPKFEDIYQEFHYKFAHGDQYSRILQQPQGLVIEDDTLSYYWQQREVYNQILPLVSYFVSKFPEATFQDLYGQYGLVSFLVPFQRAYNAIKNRKMEIINRNTFGTFLVEDGSVDADALSEEGLAPGRVLIYRQGSQKPEPVFDTSTLKLIASEEDTLISQMRLLTDSRLTLCQVDAGRTNFDT